MALIQPQRLKPSPALQVSGSRVAALWSGILMVGLWVLLGHEAEAVKRKGGRCGASAGL